MKIQDLAEKIADEQGICGNCHFWNFKCSAEKSWGQCLNPKASENYFITVRDYPDHLKEVEAYHQFRNDVKNGCEIYFEENFWCKHYQGEQK